MASINGLTAERMLEIEAASIVDGEVVGGNLILTRHDATTINAGSVIGPTGPTGPTGDVSVSSLNAAIMVAVPVGVIWDYIGAVAPAQWMTMIGQTIVGGATLHPELWAVLPASMKVGSDIVFPDTRGRVPVMQNTGDADFDTIGEVGGEKTVILTQAQLPASGIAVDMPNLPITIDPPVTSISIAQGPFTISINPPSTTVAINPPSTTIAIDPPSTTTSTGSSNHDHSYSKPTGATRQVDAGTNFGVLDDVFGTYSTGSDGAAHSHTVNIPSFNATVDIASFNVAVDIAPFNATVDPPTVLANVDIAPFVANTDPASFTSGNLGSGEAHGNVQPYFVTLKIIKVSGVTI